MTEPEWYRIIYDEEGNLKPGYSGPVKRPKSTTIEEAIILGTGLIAGGMAMYLGMVFLFWLLFVWPK
jgi:hypothetical protein